MDSHYRIPASLEDLIRHGLHALRETLQQDKELNVNNTSIGIIGPTSELEPAISGGRGIFRILENDTVKPFIDIMVPKESADAPAPAAPSASGAASSDEDVQMNE
jgi:20S proteasome subunit alpha 6